jgi:DNA-binding MarR family transcriptional regulator
MNHTVNFPSAKLKDVTNHIDRFVQAPYWILRRPELKPSAKVVLLDIIQHSRGQLHSFPSKSTIAMDLGISKRTVDRAVTQLQDCRCVTITKKKQSKFPHNVYNFDLSPDSILGSWKQDSLSSIEDELKADYFVQLPYWLMGLDELNLPQKLIYACLLNSNNLNPEWEPNFSWMKQDDIATTLAITPKSVRENLKALRSKGYIHRKRLDRRNGYILTKTLSRRPKFSRANDYLDRNTAHFDTPNRTL